MSQPAAPSAAPVSVAVLQLAEVALAHAVSSVVPAGGPLMPFLMSETGPRRSLVRFPGDLEAGQAQARQMAREPGVTRAAVAWDGYLTGPGHEGFRQDAVFVEAGEPGQPTVVFAHAYNPTPGAVAAVGQPVFVTRRPPLM